MTQHLFGPRCILGRSWRPMLLAALLLLGLTHPAQAANLYVNSTTGNDASDGSAATPFKTFRHAVDVAVSGDKIVIHGGIYDIPNGEIFPYEFDKSVDLIGAGPNETIVRGDQSSRIFFIGFGATVHIEGMTITGGKANIGGGIFNQGTVYLRNGIVSGNVAEAIASGTATARGGGIASQGNLTISNSVVSGNQAIAESVNGDAFAIGGGVNIISGTATFSNTTFNGNLLKADSVAPGASIANGGGIRTDAGTVIFINDSTISDNSASVTSSGNLFVNGVGMDNRGTATVSSSTVNNNLLLTPGNFTGSLVVNGLGVNNGAGATLTIANSTLDGNGTDLSGNFTGNVSIDATAINNDGTSLDIRNSTVSRNFVNINRGASGATIVKGTINNGGGGAVNITNSTIGENLLDVTGGPGSDTILVGGGGINNESGTTKITHVTVANNTLNITGGGGNDSIIIEGGGARVPGGSLTTDNSIWANNFVNQTPNNFAGIVISAGHNLSDLAGDDLTRLIEAGDTAGVIAFLDNLANYGGPMETYALLFNSPAIDAGNSPATDQRGFRRPVDGDNNGSAISDIGAFELVTVATTLLGAVLPTERTPLVGGPAVTASATVLNTGLVTATGCAIAPFTPVAATFTYQTLNAQGGLSGTPNTPADIPAGQGQNYVFAFAATEAFPLRELQLSMACTNSAPAPNTPVSNFGLRATTDQASDIVALVAVGPPNDGILRLASVGAFAVATVNVGASGLITVTADTGGVALPLTLNLCETNPGSGLCLAPPSPSVQTQINAGATQTFGVFADSGAAPITFDPTNNRIRVLFEGGGGGGGTSVAVCTQPLCP